MKRQTRETSSAFYDVAVNKKNDNLTPAAFVNRSGSICYNYCNIYDSLPNSFEEPKSNNTYLFKKLNFVII